ncbi:MAG TPA: hypothetical protein VN706_23905 [Gemmatimonadaceae bacterium]|nr:hypothetical protein [Gemmatimonadaceae bacterium]
MPRTPDPLRVFAKQASDPKLARLFTLLARRRTTFEKMYARFAESILHHRQVREGRAAHLTPKQQRWIDDARRAAGQANRDLLATPRSLSDADRARAILASERMQLSFDERMLPGYAPEDQPLAAELLRFQRETIELIELALDS